MLETVKSNLDEKPQAVLAGRGYINGPTIEKNSTPRHCSLCGPHIAMIASNPIRIVMVQIRAKNGGRRKLHRPSNDRHESSSERLGERPWD
jgi:hypothetical protein